MAAVRREFLVLGPLEVRIEGVRGELGGPRQRALLARLLVEPNRVVPLDRLVDDLWELEPPATARHAVRVYASALRKVVGPELRSRGGGYVLEVDEGTIDAHRFERLLDEARRLLNGDAAQALESVEEALALWRGPPLTDVADADWAQPEIARLDALHLAALETRIDAQLELGRHELVVPELEALVAENPARERFSAQLMLALYRSGRQADALAAYRRIRAALVDELGLEPGPELQALEQSILRQDPDLLSGADRVQLPSFATPLVGRRAALEEVGGLLGGDARLVTLTGAGGIGKTRLAVQAAAEAQSRFPGGVCFVALAPLRDPALVVPEIAGAVGVEDPAGDLQAAIARRLDGRQVLVVVDNFEHVDEAGPAVASLLQNASGLKLLITSRHPLRLYGEYEYPVPPLDLDLEAVPLFTERARARGRRILDLAAAAAVCRRLDCLPLAIELAAGRAAELSPEEMLELLPGRLDLATAGPRDLPVRQQTLRAAIDWSYRLLPTDERRLFGDLAVFAGGFDDDALGAVCAAGAADVRPLVDRNLVAVDGDRFSLLDTIREFASEVLEESGRTDLLRAKHAEHYLALADAADAVLAAGGDTAESLDRLELEHDNLRAALDWASAQEDGGVLELRLATALGRFWEWRGHVREGLDRLDHALQRADAAPPELHIRALVRAGVFAHMRNDVAAASARFDEALAHSKVLGDETMVANILRNLGALAKDAGDYGRARTLHEQALRISQGVEDRSGISSSLINLADVALASGDAERAEALARESVELARTLGHDVRETMSVLNLGLALLELGGDDEAGDAFTRAVELCRRLGYREGAAVAFVGLAQLAVRQGEPVAGARLLGAADAQLEAAGAVLESGEVAVRDRTRRALEKALGAVAVEAASSEGAALTFEQALDEAAAPPRSRPRVAAGDA